METTIEVPGPRHRPAPDPLARAAKRPRAFLRQLRVFVSSPGDLHAERQLVEQVVDALGRTPQIAQRFALRTLRWENDTPPVWGEAPQKLVDAYLGAARDAEIVVMLVGARLGTRLIDEKTGRPYPSGTEYELDSAYEAYRRKGKPILLVYRQEGPAVDAAQPDEPERVRRFWALFEEPGRRYQGIDPRPFSSTAVLQDRLFRDLSLVIHGIDSGQRMRRRLWVGAGALLGIALGWAAHQRYQQRETEVAVDRIVDTALKSEAAGGGFAVWEPVTDALVALGPRAVRPIFNRLGDPAIYNGSNQELRVDHSPTRALVRALAQQGAKGERDQVCKGLFQILHSGADALRYPKSTHRIVLKDGIGHLSCPRAEATVCDYLAHVDRKTFVPPPPEVLIDLREAASPPLSPDEAEHCMGTSGGVSLGMGEGSGAGK